MMSHTKRVPKTCLPPKPKQGNKNDPQNARNQQQKQSKRGCVGGAPSLGREPQAPGPRASPFRLLLPLISCVLRVIFVALCGFWGETVFGDAFGMGYELIWSRPRRCFGLTFSRICHDFYAE